MTIAGDSTMYVTRKNTEKDDMKVKASTNMDAIPTYFAAYLWTIAFRKSARCIKRRITIIPVSVHSMATAKLPQIAGHFNSRTLSARYSGAMD